jgi:hypothetical protein
VALEPAMTLDTLLGCMYIKKSGRDKFLYPLPQNQMNYPIIPQKRDLQSYSTESIPEGLYIDNNTGEVFASTNSLARLIETPESTLRSFSSSSDRENLYTETVETNIQQGGKQSRLWNEDGILAAIEKYKPGLLIAFKKCGLRVFLHGMAGFRVISTAIEHPPLTPLEQALQDLIKAERATAEAKEETAKAREELQAREIYFLRAAKDRPGLESMLDEFQEVSEQLCLPMSGDAQTEWTLHEWMVDSCEIVLEGKLFNQFKSKVHGAYKAIYHKDPRTGYRNQVNNPKKVKRLQVYIPSEFPVLQQCHMKTLMESRR